MLLAGDETAMPAIAGILDTLADQSDPPRVVALLEIPDAADRLDLRAPRDAAVHWLPRTATGAAQGTWLQAARRQLMPAGVTSDATAGDPAPEIDLDTEILRERGVAGDHGFHAWIACESGAAMAMRRYLTRHPASTGALWRAWATGALVARWIEGYL